MNISNNGVYYTRQVKVKVLRTWDKAITTAEGTESEFPPKHLRPEHKMVVDLRHIASQMLWSYDLTRVIL